MAIVIIRTLIIYTAIFVSMRLLGKRQLGEMEISEFVIAALIADLASNTLQDTGVPLINGIVPVAVLFCLEVLVAGLSAKSVRLRAFIFGRPSLLILRGKINQPEMAKNRFTVDELMEELRSQGFYDISKIEFAVLETDGELNALPFPSETPATASMLGLNVPDGGYPFIIINDGRILEANLRHAGFDLKWLDKTLRANGVKSAKDVFLLSVNPAGEIYLSKKGEAI